MVRYGIILNQVKRNRLVGDAVKIIMYKIENTNKQKKEEEGNELDGDTNDTKDGCFFFGGGDCV